MLLKLPWSPHVTVRQSFHVEATRSRDASRRPAIDSVKTLSSLRRSWPAANASRFADSEMLLKSFFRRAVPSAFSEDGDVQVSEDLLLVQTGPSSTLSIQTVGNNCRQITAAIPIEAPLSTLWSVLTDYEGLADFIPGLSVCRVQDRWENGARLFQIGEQNLAFGLKFKAKGVINVKENPIEMSSSRIFGQIDFEMIEGDFRKFQGSWQMEQVPNDSIESSSSEAEAASIKTTLTYTVEVQPKAWLPVRLVEGILSREIQNNLACVRNHALKIRTLLPIS